MYEGLQRRASIGLLLGRRHVAKQQFPAFTLVRSLCEQFWRTGVSARFRNFDVGFLTSTLPIEVRSGFQIGNLPIVRFSDSEFSHFNSLLYSLVLLKFLDTYVNSENGNLR